MLKNIRRKVRHYFFPHESNNYKAISLQPKPILFYILFLLVFQTSVRFINNYNPNILGYGTNITVERILFLVNEKRLEANLNPLVLSEKLSEAATEKAADMFRNNYWAHVSPTGVTPWKFITSSGYDYLLAGENLAKNFNTSDEVVEAWMNSPTHKANIMKPEYSEIGISVMNGKLLGEETTLVVQEFGTRSKQVQSQKIADNISSGEENTYSVLETNKTKKEKGSTTSMGLSQEKESVFKKARLPFRITKTMSLVLAEFLLLILFIDSIFILKHKTVRISGHSLFHVIFLAALIGAMGVTGIGVIL